MYPLQKVETGYTFIAANNIEYHVYFTALPNVSEYLPKKFKNKKSFYFGFERISAKPIKSVKDVFIKRTVAAAISSFFVDNNNIDAILFFNYINDENGLIKSRKKLFKKWYDEYSQYTLYHYYQHDFLEDSTFCAIYHRTNKNFENIRANIKELIKSIGEVDKQVN